MAKDFVTGFTVRDGVLEVTSLRHARGNRAVVMDTIRVDLREGDAPAPDLFDSGAVEPGPALPGKIKAACRPAKGLVSVALPSEHVLLRVLNLPTVNDDEIAGMVDIQMDKLSPFPADNTITSYEILARSDTGSTVIVAAARRNMVDALGSVMSNASLFARRLDVETLCWLQLLSDADELAEAGCQIVILRDVRTTDLVALRDGLPIVMTSMGRTDQLSDEEMCAELDYVLTALEAEHGVTRIDSLALWHWGPAPSALIAAIKDIIHGDAVTRPFDSLPSLSEGLARRTLNEGSCLNLAPSAWHAGEKRIQFRKNLAAATVVMLGIWLATILAIIAGLYIQRHRSIVGETRLAELKEPAREARRLKNLLDLIERYTAREHSALECLKEVSSLMPGTIELAIFKYDNERARQVQLQGESALANSVYDFEEALRGSRLFESVELDGPKSLRTGKHSFSITLTLLKGAE